MKKKLLAAIGVIALAIPATAAAATTAPDSGDAFTPSPSSGKIDSDFTASSIAANEDVRVVIELKGDPVAVVEAQKGKDLSSSEKKTVTKNLEAVQSPVVKKVEALGGEVTYEMQSAYNGLTATVPASTLDDIAKLTNVVAVHKADVVTLENSTSVPYLGVPAVWESTGYTGQNVKVAILDTGIDYTHATFGGPGTTEAYEEAFAASTEPADPALFGPDAPRVKGGVDLVGDDYDPNDPAKGPKPDSNPLDCQGHGSHVAGTTGGSGVTADGDTFTGPYDSTTPDQDFLVGPGVAPEVDLYAVRVFGCDGATDVVVEAIDWAVQNDMDVINMSLGSSFGTADDPSAVAATNAVGANVVVVASAGNAGPSPYLTGSPGSGDGVISVSAMDSTESWPGATLTVDGTAVSAVNANGASLEDAGPYTVVRLTDDPATLADESLGCSVSDFTRVGIAEGENQLAVVERGSCARAAKPIFGQQAGAAAVVQVNNADTLPPFEYAITENPDDGTPYVVTIPFFGVRSSDGATFVDGAEVTVASAEVANDQFEHYGSFTSSGPRTGDSAISPDVAAPGVSIMSAAVGTGNQPALLSGTSMAAPHVAGVAALTVEAHPTWSAPEISAAIVSTADADALVDQSLVRGGVGVVDTQQAVATQVTATGDAFKTESGWARESALSFGFQESAFAYVGIKTVTVTNHGKKAATYTVSSAPSDQSLPATVKTSTKKITVKPGSSAKLIVTVTGSPKNVPSALAGDEFGFSEISGDIVLTASDKSTLRVPYLMVPRSNSLVTTSALSSLTGKVATITEKTTSVKLWNLLGALPGQAEVFTWGLEDAKDASSEYPDTGYDLRAAGVQAVEGEDGTLLVFAVNTHGRFSNAAANEFNVSVDTNGDGTADWAVFSADSGSVRNASSDGRTEVFLQNVATKELYASGFLAQAPTDNGTILLPVYASSLDITGAFSYTVSSKGGSGGTDSFTGWAGFNPASPAISNGQSVEVPKNGSASFPLSVNSAEVAKQKPLGVMVVTIDNRAGKDEALLLKLKK